MDYELKKRKRIRKVYEFNQYESDDRMDSESLLDNNNKEEIFMNNDSFHNKQKIKKKNTKKKIKRIK